MNTKRLIKATFVTLMVCATAGTLFACRDKDDDKEYKVVYLGGDGATGEAPATVNYKEGDKFTVANNTFTKENHTFNGWSDGTSTYGEGVEYTMGAADVTFTAQWKENTKPEPQPDKYTVTYALGDHASSMASVPGRVKDLESGATVKMPKAPAAADGYKFIGWQIGDDTNPDNYKQPGDEIPVTKSITVTAQWASLQTRYTVTYALGDHAHADAKVPAAATELLEGATVTLPDAPKAADGYEFTGWKIGDGANAEIKKKGTFTVTGSVTVTAQWAEEGTAVKPEYITDSEIKDQIKPLWDPTKTYFVGDGEDVTIQATITAGTVLAHTGILTDMNINDDWYRFRPDAQVFGFKPWNTWDPASESNAIPAELSIDATNWDFAKYQGLFADGASCIQVVNISLEDNVVTVTVTNYAGMDTELATPVTSAKYTVTLKADTAEIKPNFFYDGGAVITAASAKAPKASNTYVNLTFDFDTDGVENAVVPMRPGKDNYKFGTDPTKPGYTFTGWKSSDETDTKLYKDTDEVAVTAAVTYTAQWTQDEYTVTYAIGENAVEGAEAPNGYTGKHYGDKINLPAEADTPAAAEGYEFKGWKVGTDTALKAAGAEVEIKGNVTITAIYEAKEQYTATFNVGDHAAEGATVPSKTVYYDDAEIDLPEAPAAAEGYEFKGWKVGTETKESGKITLTASITITAQWDAIEYTVTIDLGDYAADGVAESEAYKDIKAKYDTEINVPADPEGAAGWTFTNWKVGTTTTTVKAPATLKIKGDVTLTAQWASTQNSWKVTFKTDDNTTYATQTVAKDAEGANKKVSLPTTNPKKDGYRFLNWYIPGEDGDVDIDPENLPDVEDNMTIVAKWQAVFTVTVLDDLNGNAVTGATTEYDNNGSEGTPEKFNLPADLTEEGLTFKGWFLVVDNEGTKEYGTQVTADTDVTANVTIAAKWAITVTYELGENHVTDATAPEAEEVEKHVGKVTLPDAPAAATDHKFLGWKVGDDTELKAAGVEIDVTEHVTVTAQYGAWIVVGTDGTKGGVAWTGYRSNVENTPQWVGTLARGEKLVLKGIQKSQGINIWDGLIYSVFNGATLKGQQNVCFNHPNMDGAGEGDLVPIRSTVVDQAGAEINDATDYADRIKELNADCDITITWDWSIATNSIFLTIQYKKGEKSAEVVYGYSAPAEGTLADSYKVGLDVDCGYAEITSIEKTTVAEADLIDTVLTIGTAGNTYFYTHTTPLYSEKLQKGAKVVFTGEMTSPGTGNFQTLGALIYGAECKGYFRMDNWINDGDAIKAAENWNIVLSDAPVWDSFLGAIKDCTITLTFDWTNENEIVIFFDLTSHAEDHTRQTMKYTITATEGNTLLNEYTIGLGTDHAFTAITSIVRTPAENAD